VVDIGVRAFLPGSQYDLRPRRTGRPDRHGMQVRITKLTPRGNVVVSRRALLEENCMPSAPR